jgi:hypothetical protein
MNGRIFWLNLHSALKPLDPCLHASSMGCSQARKMQRRNMVWVQLQDGEAQFFGGRNITALKHDNGFAKLLVRNRKRLLHQVACPAADLVFSQVNIMSIPCLKRVNEANPYR